MVNDSEVRFPVRMSSLLTPVYKVIAPGAAVGLAIAALELLREKPNDAQAFGALLMVAIAAMAAWKLAPLKWVRGEADGIHVRGLRRSFHIPYHQIMGLEERRFRKLSLLAVHFSPERDGVSCVVFKPPLSPFGPSDEAQLLAELVSQARSQVEPEPGSRPGPARERRAWLSS